MNLNNNQDDEVWGGTPEYRQAEAEWVKREKENPSEADPKLTQEELLATVALDEGLTIFHDQFKETYGILPDRYRSCVRLSSTEFKRWFAHVIREKMKRASVSKVARAAAIEVLDGWAIYKNEQHNLEVRVAHHAGAVWFNLGHGQAVRIDKGGWSITNDVPILFKEVSHELPQVEPVSGGSITELFKFLNVPKNELGFSAKQLLIVAWLVTAFIPDFPHPILTFYGPHGSAKTTNADVLQALIDPSSTQSLSFPKDINELAQIAAHHHLMSFDNLSTISQQHSDMLCRICTGGGFSKRKLYSDQEDIIFQFRRIIMLNGINISLGNSDLLDRALLVGLERFSKFGSASAFWKRFEEAKPRILGAIFDLLVKALQAIETVPEDVDFRMADFARYGCAVTQVLGLDPSEFTTAYRANVDKSEDESLAASIIGPIVMSFMASRSSWEGTPTELHRGLEQEALFANVDTKAAYIWPKSPHWLKKRIELVVTILDHKGIKIRWDFPAPGRVTITNENAENIPNDGNVVLPPL